MRWVDIESEGHVWATPTLAALEAPKEGTTGVGYRYYHRSSQVHHVLINLDISKKLAAMFDNGTRSKEEAREDSMHVQRAKEDVVNRIGMTFQ